MKVNPYLEYCTRCGKCVPECPSYEVFKLESFSPRGRVFLASIGKSFNSFEYCLLCGRCEKTCPNQVSFPLFYAKLRSDSSSNKALLLKLGETPLSLFKRAMGLIEGEFKEVEYKKEDFEKNESAEVGIFVGCGFKELFPQALYRLKALFEEEKKSVHFFTDVICCGAPFLNFGDGEGFKKRALENLEILEGFPGKIYTFCATCFWIMKRVYPVVFKGTNLEERFFSLSEKIETGAQFFAEFVEKSGLLKRFRGISVIFHLPCHLTETPRLVKNKLDIQSFCCGSPRVSLWLKGFQLKYRQRWIKRLTGKQVIATFCTGCYLNFKVLLKSPIEVRHWLELV